MPKKDKKSKTAEQKARVAAKQTKKATQKEKKSKSKANDDSDIDNVDLESVLEEYARQVIESLSITCNLKPLCLRTTSSGGLGSRVIAHLRLLNTSWPRKYHPAV